jgi:hypothetical protein
MKMERTEKEKREKFVKFSNHRLQKAIEHIELIGKLANKRAYSYSESDINIISEYLTKEVNKTIQKLTNQERTEVKKWIK